jgi:molybdopterin-dependent oxidoreductase alpha subunit
MSGDSITKNSEISNTSGEETIRIVGGGPKKVLYTLKTIARIGLLNSTKALTSKNTCKACGLGMGGQLGGMTNEKKEFPSVCNKSIQAQSTDIQAAIPLELFQHTLDDFKQLSGYEMEHLGRLNNPVYKSATSNQYQAISWQQAFELMIEKFKQTPAQRSFFYSSGRSSNEAGFLLQLIARLYGTNNVNNCSYYCHQATGVGLTNVIGSGTATVSLEDLALADCIFVIGANPSSNHPRFIHQLKNCRERGGQVIVINPAKEPGLVRFAVPKSAKSMITGGSWIASVYIQPKIGSDLLLLTGIAKALIENTQLDQHFIDQHTEGFADLLAVIQEIDWQTVTDACGIDQTTIQQIADCYAKSERTIFAWGMGITHHIQGVENVEAIANLALLRGMMGKPGAGLLPLRGHSNVQGIGSVGVKPTLSADILSALEKHFSISLPKEKGMDTLACLEAAFDGKIDAALLMGGNLYSATPHSDWAQKALDKIPFKVYLTTTLNHGHVFGMETSEALILPVTARDEEWQSTTQESMFNFVRLSDGGIDRLHNVKPESWILCEFAKGLLKDSPIDFEKLKHHQSVRDAIADVIPGMKSIETIDQTKQEFTIENRLLHAPRFYTESGKAKLITPRFTVKKSTNEYPFTLASIRSEGQFNSIIYEEKDSYRSTDTRWSVLMNKQDAQSLGVTAGEKVTLTSPYGEMKDLTVFYFDVPQGNLLAYYPEANCLIGTERDPRSHTPAFKSVAVALKK